MKLRANNIHAQILECTPDERKIVVNTLTYKVKGARYSRKYQMGWWDGTISLVSRAGAFPAGLIPLASKVLKEHGHKLLVHYEDIAKPPSTPIPLREDLIVGITPYPFQRKVATEALKTNRGIIQAVTGAGKTEIAIMIAGSILLDPTTREERTGIWLTDSRDLLWQSKNRFNLRCPELKVGVVGDGRWEPSQMTIAMVDTLYKRLKDNPEETINFLKGPCLVVADEAHLAASKKWLTVLNNLVNARWRYGLTATPGLREEKENAEIEGALGPVIQRVTAKSLIELNLLAEPHIWWVKYNSEHLSGHIPWDKAYTHGIVKNAHRNRAICRIVKQEVEAGRRVVVLVIRIEHGERLYRELSRQGVSVAYIKGDNDSLERQEAIYDFSHGTLDVIIATTILDTGVDIPQIDSLVLAGGMKSSIRTYQRVGRGMRRRDDKWIVRVFDFADIYHPVLKRQARKRYLDCRAEPGYVLKGIIDLT